MSYASDKHWRSRQDAVARYGSGDDPVVFEEAIIERETPKAVLVSYDGRTPGRPKKFWVPKSQLHEDNEIRVEGEVGRVAIKRWFAEKEGLEP